MAENAAQPQSAYLEDFNEEAQTTVPESKQSANITAKRSKPDTAKSKSIRDELSDSGYSSHTNGTPESSLDSKIETVQAGGDEPDAVANIEAPAGDGEARRKRGKSPEKHESRRARSTTRKDDGLRRKDRECQCDRCKLKPRRSAQPLSTQKSSEPVAQGKSRTHLPPKVPKPRREPLAPQLNDAPPLRERPPRPRTANAHSRPVSFHAGMIPEPIFIPHPVHIERQPMSRHATLYPFLPPSYPPAPQPLFPPGHPVNPPPDYFSPFPPVYEIPVRPRPRHLISEQRAPRPQSMVPPSPPVVEYVSSLHEGPRPRPRPIEGHPARRDRPPISPEDYFPRNEDYRRMPPPPSRQETRSRQEQRPTLRHTVTSHPTLHHRRSGPDTVEGHIGHRRPRKPSTGGEASSRRPSVSRPGKATEEKVVSFDSVQYGVGHIDVEPSAARNRRRSSMYSHESLQDLEGSIEAYQAAKGSSRSPIFTPSPEELMRVTHLKTKSNSDTGSRASQQSKGSREGSETKPRNSTDRRPSTDVKPRNENENFALRFNPQGVANISMQGGIEGRTIHLRPSKEMEGEMELSIGSNRGRAIGSRPTTREKSRRRYSIIEGQAVTDVEPSTTSRSRARPAIRDDDEPKIFGERITTTMRSRRNSRYGYERRLQNE